ncbi:MAG TPA: DUF4199 domain-containing protein [Puia sp.]|nr:DUF4199 domain-containing protein [Puia sp.]
MKPQITPGLTSQTNAGKKNPVPLIFGGLASLGMILFTFCTYKAGTRAFLSSSVFLMYLIPIGCGIIAAIIVRIRNGGFLEFRAALRIIFGIMVVSMALQTVFTWLLVHVIDPGFGRELGPVVIAKMEAAWRRFKMPEDDIARNIAAAKGEDNFRFGNMFLGLARDYVIGFLISLLLAALVKRKNPAGGKV